MHCSKLGIRDHDEAGSHSELDVQHRIVILYLEGRRVHSLDIAYGSTTLKKKHHGLRAMISLSSCARNVVEAVLKF